jgi:hypothetical protein
VRGRDGVYRDAAGRPIAFTRPGDLLLFPRHVGALAADRGTIGVLDDQDLMMHTLFDTPREQAIADTGYADKPVELRRFHAPALPRTLAARGGNAADPPTAVTPGLRPDR